MTKKVKKNQGNTTLNRGAKGWARELRLEQKFTEMMVYAEKQEDKWFDKVHIIIGKEILYKFGQKAVDEMIKKYGESFWN